MPVDYSKYPKNWKKIRNELLERSENRCECAGECGRIHPKPEDIYNGSLPVKEEITRDKKTGQVWWIRYYESGRCDEMHMQKPKHFKGKRVILTTAHTNKTRNPKCLHRNKLKMMCQACHLRFDAFHKITAIKRKNALKKMREKKRSAK